MVVRVGREATSRALTSLTALVSVLSVVASSVLQLPSASRAANCFAPSSMSVATIPYALSFSFLGTAAGILTVLLSERRAKSSSLQALNLLLIALAILAAFPTALLATPFSQTGVESRAECGMTLGAALVVSATFIYSPLACLAVALRVMRIAKYSSTGRVFAAIGPNVLVCVLLIALLGPSI